MLGGGFTYYFMPQNVFVSASLGAGSFSVMFDNKLQASTEKGFSFQLKAGKEWWVSPQWGLGISFAISSTNLTSKPSSNVEDEFNSFRYALMFNTTFN